MQITTRAASNATIVELTGRLTADDGAKSIYIQLNKIISSGSRNIILDMAGLLMMDSSGLGELVRINQTLGKSLALLNVRSQEKQTFKIANLSSNFNFFDDEIDAINSFG
jgi:anti-anti-sigma factor